jgi:hypothetical protein
LAFCAAGEVRDRLGAYQEIIPQGILCKHRKSFPTKSWLCISVLLACSPANYGRAHLLPIVRHFRNSREKIST